MKPIKVTMQELGAIYCAGGRVRDKKSKAPVVENNQKADNDRNKHRALTNRIKGYGTTI